MKRYSYYYERDRMIAAMRRQGYTYKVIGKAVGLTPARVSYILYWDQRKRLRDAHTEFCWLVREGVGEKRRVSEVLGYADEWRFWLKALQRAATTAGHSESNGVKKVHR